MARLVLAAIAGVVVGCTAGAALDISAREPTEEVVALALEASVDPHDLEAAAATVGVSPHQYAYGTGLLAPPVPPLGRWTSTVACIEARESQGQNVWNRQGSGAGGVLQYMEGTFRTHAAEMARELGRPDILSWSRWTPEHARALAAWDLSKGRRAQWTVRGC